MAASIDPESLPGHRPTSKSPARITAHIGGAGDSHVCTIPAPIRSDISRARCWTPRRHIARIAAKNELINPPSPPPTTIHQLHRSTMLPRHTVNEPSSVNHLRAPTHRLRERGATHLRLHFVRCSGVCQNARFPHRRPVSSRARIAIRGRTALDGSRGLPHARLPPPPPHRPRYSWNVGSPSPRARRPCRSCVKDSCRRRGCSDVA